MKKGLNILLLTHRFHPFVGGIEVNSEILANQFLKSGHSAKVVTCTKEKGSKKFDFEVLRTPRVWGLIKAHLWADVVLENNPSPKLSWPLLFLKRKANVIAIRTIFSVPKKISGWKDRMKIWRLKNADEVIAVSKPIRDYCWPEAVVIPNPFRRELFKFALDNQRSEGFVFLGRLVSQKRCDLTIELIKRLEKSHPSKAYLSIIGDGPEMESLKGLVKDYHLENRIRFLGEIHDEKLISELNKYNFMLIPSDFEAFGNVALEGIACGNLPIVSDSGGLVGAVGKAGLSFKSSDIESFYEQTVKLIENPELEKEIRTFRDDHLNRHLPEKIGRRYMEVLERAYRKAHSEE